MQQLYETRHLTDRNVLHGQLEDDEENPCAVLDWILVKIQPLSQGKPVDWPPALKTMPPPALYRNFDGPRSVFALGYLWGTSLKLADPIDSKNLPGQLLSLYGAQSTPWVELQNTILHKFLMNKDNSGRPLFLRRSGDVLWVIVTAVTNGDSGKSILGEIWFRCFQDRRGGQAYVTSSSGRRD